MVTTNMKITFQILFVSVVLAFCSTVQAEIIYVDADAAGANDGSSWNDAHNYLQVALLAAVTGDEIRIAQGIYQPDLGTATLPGDRTATFQLVSGVVVKGGYAGFGALDPDTRDVGLYETVLTGDLAGDDGPDFANNAENSYHVVTGSGIDSTAVLDGVTITAGNANGTGTYGCGSGLYNDMASPTLTNCKLRENWARYGGGIYDVNSSPTLDGCTFTANMSEGVYNLNSSPALTNCNFSSNLRAIQNNNSSPILTGCSFSGNDRGIYNDASSPTLTECTFNSNNGAMSNWAGSSPMLTKCTFTQNIAGLYGGGIYNEYANPVMTGCTFTANSADYGGAIYNYYSNPTVTGCTFNGNSANYHSGAIRNFNSNAVFNNCTFNANTADTDGGAVGNSQSSPAMTDCTFIANDAHNHGGAIFNNAGSPLLKNCTFNENTAFAGAGIDNLNSNAILTDCSFSANSTDEYGAAIDNRQSSPQITRCIFNANIAHDFGGGAICNWSSSPTIRNCLFTENDSSERGGAVMNNQSSPVLLNCTFFGNTAAAGNAVAFYSYLNDPPGTLQAANCIFFDGGNEIWKNEETNISISYSDIQGGWPGIGNIDGHPIFVDISVGDYHLLSGSPCIDAGDPDYIPEPNETDLDGKSRVIGQRIDMGAYELTAAVPVEIGISPGVINLKSKGKYITVHITFPEEYNVADVDFNTILLQDSIQPQQDWMRIDQEQNLVMLRFSREDVQAVLNPGNIEIKITGRFIDTTPFEGTGVVKVVNKGGGKK